MSQLALANALTAKTQQLCIGLEDGVADIFELVTPTTAELLHWWFGVETCATRRLNFHDGQRQAILNTIVAHEVLNAADLKNLYQQAAPDALLAGTRLVEVSQAKHNHPKYCLKMATGTGKTWVLQALLIWQLLNKNAALAEGIDNARFTRHFLVVAPGLIVYDRLLDAFCGKLKDGIRDFASSDISQCAELFIPENYREAVFSFVRGNVCNKAEIGMKTTGNGMIAIANWHLEAEDRTLVGNSDVRYRQLSEVSKLPMRESSSLEVNKCIYPRLPYPARNGGLEKALIEWANIDSSVLAFCKISETRHEFVRLRYVKEDGLPAFYSTDFLLRTDKAIYLVETKAQSQLSSPNVQRKLKAVAAWCDRINTLPAEDRPNLPWHYVLLGESIFWEWRDKGERLAALCDFARIRNTVLSASQDQLLKIEPCFK